jgi:hypothetical protein
MNINAGNAVNLSKFYSDPAMKKWMFPVLSANQRKPTG